MRYFCFMFVFIGCFSACRQESDAENLALYDAYTKQYYSTRGALIGYLLQDMIIYRHAYNSKYEKILSSIDHFILENDNKIDYHKLSEADIQALEIRYDSIIIEINNYLISSFRKSIYKRTFPNITEEENFVSQLTKLRQFHIRFLKDYIIFSSFIKGEYPYYPNGNYNNYFPKLISTDTVKDSLQFSFLFGAYVSDRYYMPIKDTLLHNRKTIPNVSELKFENGKYSFYINKNYPEFDWKVHFKFHDVVIETTRTHEYTYKMPYHE